MKVDLYLNLHRSTDTTRVYSIRSREKESYGKVIGYSSSVSLIDCEFVVNEKGQARVKREQSKLVHAFIRGTLIDFEPFETNAASYVGYCPYQSQAPHFYCIETAKFSSSENNTPIYRAIRVNCLPNYVLAIQ
ncbi:hypothetical protein L1D55_09685 [Vibrio sp. Isolate22]|uniref:hypothetical protein n=1 Tax=Vibrio sp. Isolate22 TaxID=2908532 RepID=UPI001EFD4B41|nr:hypothetical protein [Vibrio sp. Isolate22]MCG9692017.1 hypothetical protein [Vibrio sp. Isolate22]